MTRVFFSGPAITRMIPSSSSTWEISRLPLRAESSAASLTRFDRSAPVKPGVWPASVSTSISLASGLPRVWASRIFARPLRSGRAAADLRAEGARRRGAALAVGAVDDDLTVEAARAQQRRVEDVGTVGGGDQDDVVLHLEAVHLDEQLVERLLALVVTAAEAGAAVASDGVDLVHEDDAGRVLLGLLEEVAHAAGADAHEHLDEVRARDREERHAGLAGHRAGQQRLAGARGPVEQHALRDARAERLELLRVLQELLDLVELLDRLVHAGDVAEGDLRRVDAHALGARLAEGHDLRSAALDLVHQEDPEPDEDQERQHVGQQREPAVGLAALDGEVLDLGRVVGLGGGELVGQLLAVRVDEARLVLGLVLELDGDRVVLGLHGRLGHLATVQLRQEVRERGVAFGRGARDELLREERQHHHYEDGEGGALEKPAHEKGEGPGATGRSSLPSAFRPPGPFGLAQTFVKRSYIRQVAVALGVVQAVADGELVRDLEAHVARNDLDLAPFRLRQQRADLQRRGVARAEIPHQILQGQARVDDVLDDQHVAALDRRVEVLEDPHHAAGVGLRAVAGHGHEVDLDRDVDLAHQIAEEEHGALQDADEQQVAAVVVARDLGPELGHPRPQLVRLDEHLPDRHAGAHSTVTSGVRSKQTCPATAAACGIGSS